MQNGKDAIDSEHDFGINIGDGNNEKNAIVANNAIGIIHKVKNNAFKSNQQ